jgi:hypothetical protein
VRVRRIGDALSDTQHDAGAQQPAESRNEADRCGREAPQQESGAEYMFDVIAVDEPTGDELKD